MICACNVLKDSVCAIENVKASAAMVLMCGPPCSPGKSALSILLARDLLSVMMQAPRGPIMVLWVVKVITWAKLTGEGTCPAAISPAM